MDCCNKPINRGKDQEASARSKDLPQIVRYSSCLHTSYELIILRGAVVMLGRHSEQLNKLILGMCLLPQGSDRLWVQKWVPITEQMMSNGSQTESKLLNAFYIQFPMGGTWLIFS